MRLINTITLEQKEFFDSQLPKYAILSHTWGADEVSLKRYLNDPQNQRKGSGWWKILDFVRIAKTAGFFWVWCDTCCIDKTSSAELSEAINSMYSWYQQAHVCFAFLEDFDASIQDSTLSTCRWFTRGWTLQELLAPPAFEFYDGRWAKFGSRLDLAPQLQRITGIPVPFFRGDRPISEASTAQRMCWASKRQTTRPEDEAYSLLGLFDVSMPLLYGEGGQKAFARLQRQILSQPRDDTIYCWYSTEAGPRGLLAESPREFAQCPDIGRKETTTLTPPIVTDQGVEVAISSHWSSKPRFMWLRPELTLSLCVPVACRLDVNSTPGRTLFVVLQQPKYYGDVWTRKGIRENSTVESRVITEIYVLLASALMRINGPFPKRITVALSRPSARHTSDLQNDRREPVGNASAMVVFVLGLIMDTFRAGVLLTALYSYSHPVTTSTDVINHVVFGWITLTCYWKTTYRSVSAILSLLLVLLLFFQLPFGFAWVFKMSWIAFFGEYMKAFSRDIADG